MSEWFKAVSLVAFSIPLASYASTCNNTWTEGVNGNWSNVANWGGGCIPGVNSIQDRATFSGAPALPAILDIPTVTLSSLTLSATSPFTINPASSVNLIEFETPNSTINITSTSTQTIATPIILDTTNMTVNFVSVSTLNLTNTLTFQNGSTLNIVAASPTNINHFILSTDLNMSTDTFTCNSGVLAILQNVSVVNGEIDVLNITAQGNGTDFQATSLNLDASTLLLQNTVPVNGFASNGGSDLSSHNGIIAANSTISMINSGHITTQGVGASIVGDLSLTNTPLSLLNQGVINNGGFGVEIIGSNLSSEESLITLTNNSVLSGASNKTTVGNSIQLFNNFTMYKSQMILASESLVSNKSMGNMINAQNFSIDTTGLILTNTGPVSTGIAGVPSAGNIIEINGDFTSTDSAVILSNSGNIGNFSYGSSLFANTITINNGFFTNVNTGAVSNSSLAQISVGSYVLANTQMTIIGGSVLNENFGTAHGNSFGSLIQSPAILITGGSLENDAIVQSTNIAVQGSGVLAGNGIYEPLSGTLNVVNSGTVAPGSLSTLTPGTLTIQGNYEQTSSGTLLAIIGNPTTFSLLDVTDTASLDGSLEIALANNFDFTPGRLFDVLQSSGGIQGRFANIINDTRVFQLEILYSADNVFVALFPTLGKYIGGFTEALFSSVNCMNLHILTEMERIRDHFSSSPKKTSKKIASYFQEDAFHVPKHPFENSEASIVLASNRPAEFESLTSLGQTEEKQEQLRREVSLEQKERPWNFYAGPTARAGRVQKRKDQTGLGYWTAGGLVGFDYAFQEVGVGLLANYERIDGHARDFGKMTIDEIHASLYATYVPIANFAINGIVGGGYEFYDIKRNTGTALNKKIAKGKPNGAEFDALIGVEYAIQYKLNPKDPINRMQFIPLASLQYIHLNVDGYKEHNAGLFEMEVNGQRAKSLRSTLGLRTNYYFEQENFSFIPELLVAWQREFLDKERSVQFTPISFEEFGGTLVMPKSGRNTAILGADFLFTFYDQYGIEANYNFEWNQLFHDHFFYLGFNMRF